MMVSSIAKYCSNHRQQRKKLLICVASQAQLGIPKPSLHNSAMNRKTISYAGQGQPPPKCSKPDVILQSDTDNEYLTAQAPPINNNDSPTIANNAPSASDTKISTVPINPGLFVNSTHEQAPIGALDRAAQYMQHSRVGR